MTPPPKRRPGPPRPPTPPPGTLGPAPSRPSFPTPGPLGVGRPSPLAEGAPGRRPGAGGLPAAAVPRPSPPTGGHPVPAALRTTRSHPALPTGRSPGTGSTPAAGAPGRGETSGRAAAAAAALDPERIELWRRDRLARIQGRPLPLPSEAVDKASKLVRGMLELRLGRGQFVLPILPAIAAKLMSVLDAPELGVHEVSDIVSADAAVAAKLVQVANSPVFLGTSPVKTVAGAIVRLGMRTTCSVVTAACLQGIYVTPVPGMQELMEDLFCHSYATAILARGIGLALQHRPADEAFLAGLLHDIASPLILRSLGEIMQANRGVAYGEAEAVGVLAQLHADLGGVVLHKWELPPELVSVARRHDGLGEADEHADLGAIVFVADAAAKRCGYGIADEPGLEEAEARGCARLALPTARLDEIKRDAEARLGRELLLLLA